MPSAATMARSLSLASYFSRRTSRIRRIDNLSVGIQQTSSGTRSPWPAQTVARPALGTLCSGARDPVESLPTLPWNPCPRSRGISAHHHVEYAHRTGGLQGRVVEYQLEGIPEAEPLYRVVTSILDPQRAPAAELAALYHERWEIEVALAELKTQLRGARVVLRSKTPELVRQEVWGLLLAHFAVRGLMHEAAPQADEDPDRLSFSHAVRVARRKVPQFAALSPSDQARPA